MLRKSNNRMPDVLDCLANLSNDEVFTPPSVVNKMLDMLPQEVFESKDTTFLDPFTKSGVFLREITKRLLEHQVPAYKETANEIELITKEAIQEAVHGGKLDLMDKDYEDKARAIGDAAVKRHPDAVRFIVFEKQLQDALDHILTKQVFGIAITELTANLARRSLYCSKDASGKYGVSGKAFQGNAEGNIRFVPMKHTWNHELKFNPRYQKDKHGCWIGAWQGWDDKNKKFVSTSCVWCGTSPEQLERADDLEAHAYEFIHRDNVEDIYMGFQFTVVCGNPPYQLADGGAQASAIPIYNKFIEQAKRLNPRYLTMIVPSRWMTGGKGLDKFRDVMIHDDSIRELHDFADSKMCFSGVDIKGGVCYFLRDREYHGDCRCVRYRGDSVDVTIRPLCEAGDTIFIREPMLISIKNKIDLANGSVEDISSSQKPYGLRGDVFKDESKYGLPCMSDIPIVGGYSVLGLGDGQRRIFKYVSSDYPFPKLGNIDKYKLFVSRNWGVGDLGDVPSSPVLAVPGMACTETFIEIGSFDTKEELDNFYSYFKTKFFRALVMVRKQDQSSARIVYHYVPMQDFSKSWTDAELYAKYNLIQEEIDFIESMIKPME